MMSRIPSDSSTRIVNLWTEKLPLASMLATLLQPRSIVGVSVMTSEEIEEVVRIFSGDVSELLKQSCSDLKQTLSGSTEKLSNSKFGFGSGTYIGSFGKIEHFHTSIYDEIGNPNPHWEKAMQFEHMSNTDEFLTSNYQLKTCPRYEWDVVANDLSLPESAKGHGRTLKAIDEYMRLDLTKEAGLTRPEVIALVLYTGPMYMVLNCILRKFPKDRYNALKAKDCLFSTTIFVLMSAVQKISQVMVLRAGQSLYRGIDGNMDLPDLFIKPDAHGCLGMMDSAFMSTTAELGVAISYTGIEWGKAHPRVLEIRIGSVDRGADISQYSQYPGEKEFLWNPHAFLEPIGGDELIVTEHGLVEVVKVRVNSNIKVITLEEYTKRKKDMHSNSFKFLLQDLSNELDMKCTNFENQVVAEESEMMSTVDPKKYMKKCIEQVEDVRNRHAQRTASEFNDDAIYRRLVEEMLLSKTCAQVKMDYMLQLDAESANEFMEYPLRVNYRDWLGDQSKKLEIAPDAKKSLELCKIYGLLERDTTEVNEIGEPPLLAACADGVTDDKLELLIAAGSDVNHSMSYSNTDVGGYTALLTAALYGRASLVSILAAHGADVNAGLTDGITPMYYAAGGGHTATVKVLASLGADLNAANLDGYTPLHVAAQEGYAASVEALLSLGADASIEWNGQTAKDIAESYNHTQVVEVFQAAAI